MKRLILLLAFLPLACAPDLAELPGDIDLTASTDYTALTDSALPDDDMVCPAGTSAYLGSCVVADLVVATTGGYDAPHSGHILIAPGERLNELRELTFPTPLGGPEGTDLSLATAADRLMVVGRDGADTVWVYEPRGDDPRYTTFGSPVDGYTNFYDALWDGTRYIVSANQLDRLLLFDGSGKPAGEIPLDAFAPDGTDPAPAALLRIGGRTLTALQLLGPDWLSRGGRLARHETDGTPLIPIDLPLNDPTSKLAVNPLLSPDQLFVSCSGSYQARNGGIVRVDLFTGAATAVLYETTEEHSPLNVKVGDLAVLADGRIYFTAMDGDWQGHLQVLEHDGTVRRVVSDINAFAAISIDQSPFTGRLYFFDQIFVDNAAQSRLNALDIATGNITTIPFDGAPSALRVWIHEPSTSSGGTL